MSKCFFLDWCPVSLPPLFNHVAAAKTIPLFKNEIFEYGDDLPESTTFWMRTDGIFIFCADFPDAPQNETVEERKERKSILTKKAKLISQAIRISEGKNRSELFSMLLSKKYRDRRTFNMISISPRKLSDSAFTGQTDDQIRAILKSPELICDLRAQKLGTVFDEEAPAILMLRQQFSKCFEEAYLTANKIKGYRLQIPAFSLTRPLLRLQQMRLKAKGLPFMFLLFISFVALISVPLAWHNSSMSDGVFRFRIADFFWAFAYNLSVCSMYFLAIFLVVEVFFKRNRCIKIYQKTQSVLTAGNIYCSAIENLIEEVEEEKIRAKIFKRGDFTSAIETLERWKNSEKRKKRIAQAIVIPGIFISFIPISLDLEKKNPHLHNYMDNALKTVGLSMPKGVVSSKNSKDLSTEQTSEQTGAR